MPYPARLLDEPVVLSRLVLRYVVTGLVALVVVALVTAYASRSLGIHEAVRDATRVAFLTAGTAVEPVLDDGILARKRTSLTTIDRVVRGRVLRGSLIRVKIWDRNGTVLYSDEARLIGQRFTLREDELQALNGGEPQAQLSDLSEPENRYEERAAELLEVYVPVRTRGGIPLLFEAYFRYLGVAEAGRGLWLRFAPYSLGALVLLELLQVPLALSLARRLRRTQNQREALLHRAIESADEERQRIASDLHDGVVQDLAGVAFSLSAMAREPGDAEKAAETRQSADRVRNAVRSLRSLVVDIYPPNLYEEGLQAALSDLLARVEPRGIQTSLVVDAPVERLDVDVAQLFYRVAQEGLRNVVAHADAAHVMVSITEVADSTVMEISDDGRGLDATKVPERGDGLGLKALAGLADIMGASLAVRSTPGRGTVLALDVPAR